MLRRAAIRGCGGSGASKGHQHVQPSFLMVGRRASSAPAAPAPLLLQRQQQQQMRHMHVITAGAACGVRRARGSSSCSSFCTLPPQRGALSLRSLPLGHHGRHHEQHRQQGFASARLAPHAQWRALLSTAPPTNSKEDDKPAASATPSALPTATATTNDPTPAAAPAAEEAPTKKPTWKDMLKKHGPVFLIYWNGMWLLSGLTIYAGLTLGGIDPLPLAYAVNLDRLIDLSRLDPAHGNVAVAIVLNEAAELVRFPLVVATVPRVTRWWEGVRPEWLKPKLGPDGKPKPTLADQIRRHGPTFAVWWGTLWVAGAAGLFGAFEYELFGAGVDALSLARSVNLDQFINLEAIPPSWGNLGVAIAFNEALEVVRFPLAVATVPYLTRWWERRKGQGGPPPSP